MYDTVTKDRSNGTANMVRCQMLLLVHYPKFNVLYLNIVPLFAKCVAVKSHSGPFFRVCNHVSMFMPWNLTYTFKRKKSECLGTSNTDKGIAGVPALRDSREHTHFTVDCLSTECGYFHNGIVDGVTSDVKSRIQACKSYKKRIALILPVAYIHYYKTVDLKIQPMEILSYKSTS